MDDLLAEFLTETNESLQALDVDLVKLEQNPNDAALLSQIFRVMHTIKGTCGFLGLPRLETVAHNAENVLGLFREGELEVTPEYVTVIFESLDRVRYILAELEASGQEPEGNDGDLIDKLNEIYLGTKAPAPQAALEEAIESLTQAPQEPVAPQIPDQPQPKTPESRTARNKAREEEEEETETGPDLSTIRESSVAAQSLRVNVDVLENLMTMVSELVLTRNQLLQILRAQKESEFSTPLQRLNHVVSELQEGVMKTRMQPIGNAWAKLPRIIRDISMELGKKIDLEMRGQDTELDRQVLELIKDPLTHMVRNSADHGLESPRDRQAAGKPETGRIRLNSYHEGGHIIIVIADDGRGLSISRIKKKALENGLATEDELAAMTAQQIQQFIFRAGFSTAEKVTSVSGRGVGMDVVKTNIEKIGGSIELKSVEGKGTTFIIKIPLTLAIVSALIVESAGERFAIPQLAVRELVMTTNAGDNRIETIKGTPVFRLRDHLLPLISLKELLHLKKAPAPVDAVPAHADANPAAGTTDAAVPVRSKRRSEDKYIVVTQVGAYFFGIIVDRVYDTEEIVVKPVAQILRSIDIFSGNTILGDGSVIMILDPAGIAKSSGEIETSESLEPGEAEQAKEATQEKTSLLLFAAGDGAPKTVPLALVSRLEEIKPEAIEWARDQMVVQYRGHLMPLVLFDPAMSIKDRNAIPLLVFADENNAMGLIVDRIIDITEEYVDVQMAGRDGLVGSAIINNKATDVIDVAYFLKMVNKSWFTKETAFEKTGTKAKSSKSRRRVLLVEDSPFFRNMLTPLLSVAGYEVTTAESPLKALEMCEAGEEFDIIVSDIEMPDMSGFEFAERVKDNPNWKDTPLVALSSHATPQDMDRGRQAGFENYVAKFDRETLLSTLSKALSGRGEA